MSNLNENQFTTCSEGEFQCQMRHSPDPVLEVGKTYKVTHLSPHSGRPETFTGTYTGPITRGPNGLVITGSHVPVDGFSGWYTHGFTKKNGEPMSQFDIPFKGHIISAIERQFGKRTAEQTQSDRESLLSKIDDTWSTVPPGHSPSDVDALEKAGHIETRISTESRPADNARIPNSSVVRKVKMVRRVQK